MPKTPYIIEYDDEDENNGVSEDEFQVLVLSYLL